MAKKSGPEPLFIHTTYFSNESLFRQNKYNFHFGILQNAKNKKKKKKKIRHTLELKHEAVVTSAWQNRWYLLLMKEGSLCWKFIFEKPSFKNHQFCSAKLLIFIYSDPWRVLSIEQSCFNWNSSFYSPLLVSST